MQELIILWLLPALVTFLVCLAYMRFRGINPSEVNEHEWNGIMIASVLYPIALAMIGGAILMDYVNMDRAADWIKAAGMELVKERSLR